MAKFTYTMSDEDAAKLIKNNLVNGGMGSAIPLNKDLGKKLIFGMSFPLPQTVTIELNNGNADVSCSMIGKTLYGTVVARLEGIEGFTKING